MDFILKYLHFEFSIIFIIYLFVVYLINNNTKTIFKHNRHLFYVQYVAVWIHELCHYVAALMCLKLPKFNPIKIEHDWWKLRISWSVNVKVYTYKELIYHIVNWDKVTATIFLLWELFSGFVIWLAPIIFPFLFIYFFLLPENLTLSNETWGLILDNDKIALMVEYLKDILINWKIILIIPLFLFFAQVSSVSKEDIFNALPGIFVLITIPISVNILDILVINTSIMFVILVLSLFINLLIKSRRFFSPWNFPKT